MNLTAKLRAHFLVASILPITSAALIVTAATAAAQERCSHQNAFDYLGITGIECFNCSFQHDNDSNNFSFRSEPRIARVDPGSRAAAFLKAGDLIAEVDHKAITTPEGAAALANLKRGESVVLTVKRDGKLLQYALTADTECRTSDSWNALPKLAATPAAPAAPAALPTPAPMPSANALPTPALAGFGYRGPRASYGMSMSCSDCWTRLSDANQSWSMGFSRPPSVYSVERGGPADKAGIRRGDVITHVNGKPIDSEAGGRAFAAAKPGDRVKFTVRRGKETKTFVVQAIERPALPAALAAARTLNSAGAALDGANQALRELQRAQHAQLQRLQEEYRTTQMAEDAAMREARRRMLDEEREHSQRLEAVVAEMARARGRMAAALADSARALCATGAVAPVAAGSAGTRTLRYTGNLAGANVEVRGAPVSVSETEDEIVITTGATVVRVQKRK